VPKGKTNLKDGRQRENKKGCPFEQPFYFGIEIS
jgi:hypothetical protein